MITKIDQRRVIGALITAKAIHVSNLTECTRQFGSNKKTKVVLETLIAVTYNRNSGSNRIIITITGDYNLGGGTMQCKTFNIKSVRAHIDAAVHPNLPLAGAPSVAPENSVASVLNVADRKAARTAAAVAVDPACVALAAACAAAAASLASLGASPIIAAPPPSTTAPTPSTTATTLTLTPITTATTPHRIAHGTKWFADPASLSTIPTTKIVLLSHVR